MDASGSMAGQPSRDQKQAAIGFVDSLDLPDNPQRQFAVVQYNSVAKTLSQLTNDRNRAVSAINQVGAAGGTAIDAGIREGLKAIMRGRRGGEPNGETEVMIVLSDGANNAGCQAPLQAAAQAINQGVLLITACVGSGCDAQCMRLLASSPLHFHHAASASDLAATFDEIRRALLSVMLSELRIVVTLGDATRYVPDSARPDPYEVRGPDVIEWRSQDVPQGGVDLTFAVEPLPAGTTPAFLEARGTYTDNLGAAGEFRFGAPFITVLDPRPVAQP
jgi:Ca-activated chloride channel family protein